MRKNNIIYKMLYLSKIYKKKIIFKYKKIVNLLDKMYLNKL